MEPDGGAVPQPAVRVRDPQALRALAHPLRLTLLGLLRLEGPSTATRLGRRAGESSGAASYHLRELARYGFVSEVRDRGTARERWWQATHGMTSWSAADFAADAPELVDQLHRYAIGLRARLLSGWLADRATAPGEWEAAASLNDYALRLTPDQARALTAELTAVTDRWRRDHPTTRPAEGSEVVAVILDVLPVREWPTSWDA